MEMGVQTCEVGSITGWTDLGTDLRFISNVTTKMMVVFSKKKLDYLIQPFGLPSF